MSYQDFRRVGSPAWLRQTLGNAWNDSHASLEDAAAALAKEAVKASFPGLAPADALPALGADLGLEQGAGESAAAFRARLLVALDAWAWAGTEKGLLLYALTPAGFTNAGVIRNRDWTPPDGDTASWARVWVVIAKPNPWTADGAWNSGGTWGDGGTWGSDATPEEVAMVRRLIRTWIPAHVVIAGIFVACDDAPDLAAAIAFEAAFDASPLAADFATTNYGDFVQIVANDIGAAGNANTVEAVGAGVTAPAFYGGADHAYGTFYVDVNGASGTVGFGIAGLGPVTVTATPGDDAATAAALSTAIASTVIFDDPPDPAATLPCVTTSIVGSRIYFEVALTSSPALNASIGLTADGASSNSLTLEPVGTGITASGPTPTGGTTAWWARTDVTFDGAAGIVGAVVNGTRITVIATTDLMWDGE